MNKPIKNLQNRPRRARTADMLSADEERHLVQAWQGRGDRRARDRLILAFAPLAESAARRFGRRSGSVDPDLLQQANIGLIKAADRFDPDRDIRFSTYAVWWVRAEIQAYMRANSSVVRRPNSAQARQAAVRIAGFDAEEAAGAGAERAGADERLAEALGVDTERAATLRAQVTGSDHSLNVPALGEEGEERISLLVDPASLGDPLALQRLETTGLRRVLADVLSALPKRERDIIIATQVMDPPATLEGLGAQYGVSKERVRQLRERGFERLRESMRRRHLGPESFF